MGALTPQFVVDAGTKPNFSLNTVSTSDTAVLGTGHNTFVVYKNAAGASTTLTVVVPGNTTYGQPMPDASYTIPATTGEVWIPLRKEFDDGTGTVTLTLTSATSVTAALVVMS